MMCERPELTAYELAQCKQLKQLYKSKGTVTRDDIVDTLDISGSRSSQDRKVRDLQSIFSGFYPIINLSSEQGSRMADLTAESWEDAWGVFRNRADFLSRINKLQRRIDAMDRYLAIFMKKHGIVTETELENKLRLRCEDDDD